MDYLNVVAEWIKHAAKDWEVVSSVVTSVHVMITLMVYSYCTKTELGQVQGTGPTQ